MHHEMLIRSSNKKRRLSQVPRSEAGELPHISCGAILVDDPVVVAFCGTTGLTKTVLNDSIPGATFQGGAAFSSYFQTSNRTRRSKFKY